MATADMMTGPPRVQPYAPRSRKRTKAGMQVTNAIPWGGHSPRPYPAWGPAAPEPRPGSWPGRVKTTRGGQRGTPSSGPSVTGTGMCWPQLLGPTISRPPPLARPPRRDLPWDPCGAASLAFAGGHYVRSRSPSVVAFPPTGRFSHEITLEELESCFHLPTEQACKRLGVGESPRALGTAPPT